MMTIESTPHDLAEAVDAKPHPGFSCRMPHWIVQSISPTIRISCSPRLC
jgi:hypothetical protein